MRPILALNCLLQIEQEKSEEESSVVDALALAFRCARFCSASSIFRDNNVISAIPSYFENTESPIICYKYNKPIRNTILNFNKLVSDLDIETSSPDS